MKIVKIVVIGASLSLSSLYGINPLVNTFLVEFDNQTDDTYYRLGIVSEVLQFLLAPQSSMDLRKREEEITRNAFLISDNVRLNLITSKGSQPSVYVKFGGMASGDCKPGFVGPYYIEVWNTYPDLPQFSRQFFRFCQKKDGGNLGIRIFDKGEVEVYALDDSAVMLAQDACTLEATQQRDEDDEDLC